MLAGPCGTTIALRHLRRPAQDRPSTPSPASAASNTSPRRNRPCTCPAPASTTSPPPSGAPTAGARPPDLTQAGNEVFGANVFSAAEQRKRLPKHVYGSCGDDRARREARHLARRRGRAGDEGVGAGERRHALHALVPAADRPDRREARLLLQPGRRRHRDRRLLRQGADPGRARRVELPDRRHPRDLRGARLHGLGPDLAGVPAREPQRRAAVHPDRVRVVDRRGARPQDPAAALDGRAVGGGDPRAELLGDRGAARLHHGRAPSRSTS